MALYCMSPKAVLLASYRPVLIRFLQRNLITILHSQTTHVNSTIITFVLCQLYELTSIKWQLLQFPPRWIVDYPINAPHRISAAMIKRQRLRAKGIPSIHPSYKKAWGDDWRLVNTNRSCKVTTILIISVRWGGAKKMNEICWNEISWPFYIDHFCIILWLLVYRLK